MFHSKKFSIAGALVAGLALVGCMGEDTAPTPDVTFNVSTTVEGVNNPAALSKGNLISLSKLIIVLSSNATPADTVRDTILAGQNGFVATSTASQTVSKNYTVKGLRTWTVTASVRDSKDSLTHSAVTVVTPSFQKLADTSAVSLSLSSRFTMYRAIFASKPDSVSSSTGPNKQQIRFKRLVVKIDGVIRVDSTHPTFFSPNTADTLYYDYVPVNGSAKTVRFIAYGNIVGSNPGYNDSLFAGNVSVAALAAGGDASTSLTLSWVGPNTGVEKVGVTIGKVGVATINGGGYCSGGCVPKTSK